MLESTLKRLLRMLLGPSVNKQLIKFMPISIRIFIF